MCEWEGRLEERRTFRFLWLLVFVFRWFVLLRVFAFGRFDGLRRLNDGVDVLGNETFVWKQDLVVAVEQRAQFDMKLG